MNQHADSNESDSRGQPPAGIYNMMLTILSISHTTKISLCHCIPDQQWLGPPSHAAPAYGITKGRSHLANWRLLFLVVGLATVTMTHHLPISSSLSPDKARSLGTEEKEIVKARSMRQVGTEPSV